MISLGRAIKASYWLKVLNLDFSWCSDINDEAASTVIKSIATIYHLKDLSLNFSGYGNMIKLSFT